MPSLFTMNFPNLLSTVFLLLYLYQDILVTGGMPFYSLVLLAGRSGQNRIVLITKASQGCFIYSYSDFGFRRLIIANFKCVSSVQYTLSKDPWDVYVL